MVKSIKEKVLNLYAGIGGNRKLWDNVDVTAIEIDPKIAKIYQGNFPDDKVIITDAHKFLLEHFKEFDFIWSSPPCQTHSRARFWGWGNKRPVYPDMRLYQEILFLKHYFKGKWNVENVVSFYEPLIKPITLGRHFIWSNFQIIEKEFKCRDIRELSGTSEKDKLIRNMVNSELGLHILNCARKNIQQKLVIT